MNRIFKKNRIVPVLPSTGVDNRVETPDYKVSSKVNARIAENTLMRKIIVNVYIIQEIQKLKD